MGYSPWGHKDFNMIRDQTHSQYVEECKISIYGTSLEV